MRSPPQSQPVALALLQHVARNDDSSASLTINWHRADIRDQWHHINLAGLAPLLYQATRAQVGGVPAYWQDALQGANLSAQVRHGNLVDTASEIVDVCSGLGIQPTLLKGISISELYYPAEHARPMGDVDILVPHQACATVEEALLGLGYLRGPDHDPAEGRNHGSPLHHPERDVWVEVHSGLFPPEMGTGRGALFGARNVEAESVASMFQDQRVHRLSMELQLAYVARGWLNDILHCKPHPSFVPSLFDFVFLLRDPRRTADWNKVLGWMRDEPGDASLYIMLSYLAHLEVIQCPIKVIGELGKAQQVIGMTELRIVHSILDHHLLGRRSFSRFLNDWHAMNCLNTLVRRDSLAAKLLLLPWNVLFPPQLPDRYGIRLQLDRLRRMLRGQR